MEAVLALKKTKAQAARTRAQYALQQAKIQKEKAQLDVDLDVLNAEIEHAAAAAEVFLDILNEIESLNLQAPYRPMLAGYDTFGGSLANYEKTAIQNAGKMGSCSITLLVKCNTECLSHHFLYFVNSFRNLQDGK